MLNLLIYNVLGGGESHLYGTEGPLFYLRNGFNNFNVCFVLALLFVGILPISRKKYVPDLLVVISPIYIWLAFMSLQPHKEERFDTLTTLLYVFLEIIILRELFLVRYLTIYSVSCLGTQNIILLCLEVLGC